MSGERPAGYTLRELGERIGAEPEGEFGLRLRGIRSLEDAGPQELSFFTHPRYRRQLESTRAGAVIVPRDLDLAGRNLLRAAEPYLAFARAVELFHPAVAGEEIGVSAQAFVAPGCRIAARVSVHPFAYVGPGCELAEGVRILPGAVLVGEVRVGAESVIHPQVTVYRGTVIGCRVVVHAGTVLGSDGFGYVREGGRQRKIPQVGRVIVEDDVEIGAGVTIDRATLGETRIGRGTKIDNLVQIAHNVIVGEDSLIVAQVGISGSTQVGRRVTIAGQAGVAGHLAIGDGATITARAGVTKSVPGGGIWSGFPLLEHGQWRKVQAACVRLPSLFDRLRRLERALLGREGGGRAPEPAAGEAEEGAGE